MIYSKHHPDFTTITCLKWNPILEDDRHKEIIINSLRFLTKESRAVIYGFVIMMNHFHLIWQIMGEHDRGDVQRDFLKFTGQQILKNFRNENSLKLKDLFVQAKDRKYQVWERNSLSIPLWTPKVLLQKLEYIHNNPIRAGLCKESEDYKYSSARFYLCNEKDWGFLQHFNR